jgi:hypothetical protein
MQKAKERGWYRSRLFKTSGGISERPPQGGLSVSGEARPLTSLKKLVASKFLGYETKPDGATEHQTDR